jgi:hypothetical protein
LRGRAAAANRDDGSVLPLPRKSKLDRETADGVVNDLLKKKLVAERPAIGPAAIWRESEAARPRGAVRKVPKATSAPSCCAP